MTNISVNGKWKEVDKTFINDNGTWKEVSQIKRLSGSGGTWVETVDVLRLAYSTFPEDASHPMPSPFEVELGSFDVVNRDDNQWSTSSGSLRTSGGGAAASGQTFQDAVARQVTAENKTIAIRTKVKAGWIYVGYQESGLLSTHLSGHRTFLNGEEIPLDNGGVTPRNLVNILHPSRSFKAVEVEAGRFCLVGTAAWSSFSNIKLGLFTSGNVALEAEDIEIIQLRSGVFTSEYSLATSRLAGSRAENDIFTHEIFALIQFTVTTLGTSGFAEVSMRRIDEDNKTILRVEPSGRISLIEVIEGEEYELISASSGAISGATITILLDSSRVIIGRGGGVNQHVSTNLASVGFSATEGRLERLDSGWAVSNIIAWPYDISNHLSFFGGLSVTDDPEIIVPEIFSSYKSAEIDSPLYIDG